MIVNLKSFVNLPAKVILLRRSDFAAFYQVVIENIYSHLLSNIKYGDVVIDAGANIGCFSILASFKVKDKGKVIAIEPEPNYLKILKQNVELNKLNNVIVIPKALYDKPGKMVSIKGEGVGAYVSEDGEGLVETTTIDKIVEETDLKPRILKMDIEGSEGQALIGGINTLKHLELIEIEVHDEENMKKVEEILSGGSISFEAIRWLSKHDVSIALLNWNGNLLSLTLSQETLNAKLKIKQYEKYINPESRLYIAGLIVRQKVKSSVALIRELSQFYDIDMTTINKEIERIDYNNINSLMMYEGRIASVYWSELSKIFNFLAEYFHFEGRKNLSYSWNMNASEPINP